MSFALLGQALILASIVFARTLREYAKLPLRGECRFRAPIVKSSLEFPLLNPVSYR